MLAAAVVTHEEYEALRADGSHFAVAPDESHVFYEVEDVVERHELERLCASLQAELDASTPSGRAAGARVERS